MKRGYTVINEESIVYEWKINNIAAYIGLTHNNWTINSPEFSTEINKRTWELRLVCEKNSKRPNWDEINLQLICRNHYNYHVKYSVYVLNNEKEKKLMKSDHRLESNDNTILTLTKKFLLENEKEYLSNKTLIVGLDLTVYNTPTNISLNISSKRQMIHDYKELYSTKFGSDVCLNVSGKEFEAHKTCLIARSPVLAAMFSHEMVEKKTNKVDIKDLNPIIFEKMLEYIYTDEVTNLDDHAEDLLEAANKYQLQSLKDMCQESLSKTLTVENSLKIKTLADLHGADQLLEFTTNFMATNLESIVETQNFQDFKKENLTAAFDLLKNLTFYLKKT